MCVQSEQSHLVLAVGSFSHTAVPRHTFHFHLQTFASGPLRTQPIQKHHLHLPAHLSRTSNKRFVQPPPVLSRFLSLLRTILAFSGDASCHPLCPLCRRC